jgi:N4-gp56 family major capsid protein
MAQFTWTWDAPTGTYKSHALSRRLYRAAIEEAVMMDHVQPVEGFGRKRGEDITITRVRALAEPADPRLREGERIPEDTLVLSTTAIKVAEFGRSVPYTSLAEDLSEYNIENAVQRALRDQMRLSLDTAAAQAAKRTRVKYAPTGTAGSPTNNISTTGSFGATASRNLQIFDLEEIRDYLYDTLLAPGVSNDEYVGIFRWLALRGIMRDQKWEEWHKYTTPQAKYNGEVGKIEAIRLIGTNHARAFGKVGTGSVLGEGVVFGQDAIAMVEALTPELRAAIPGDFGRQKAVAWYGLLEFGLYWDTANPGECRIVHVGSA